MNFQDMDALGGLIAGNKARMDEDTTLFNQQKTLAELAKMQQEYQHTEQMNPLKMEYQRAQTAQSNAAAQSSLQATEESRQRVTRENAARYVQDMIQFGDAPGAEDALAEKWGVKGHPVQTAFQQAKKRGAEAAMMSDQVDPLQYARQLQEKLAQGDDKSRQATASAEAAFRRQELSNQGAAEREAERTRRAIMVAQIGQQAQVKAAEIRAKAAELGHNQSLNQYAAELMKAAFTAQASGQPELAQQKLDEANMVTDALERIAAQKDDVKRRAEEESLYKLSKGKIDIRGSSKIPQKPKVVPGAIPPDAIKELRANPTDQMKKFFDESFGPGAADKVLGGGQGNPKTGYRDTRERPMSDAEYATQEPQIASHLQRPTTEPPALEAILKAEGTGKNPNSSAVGTGQFIDSTMLAKFRQWYPQRAAGMSDREILAQRQDPDLMREMTARYMQENAAGLQKSGFSPTGGNVYLAHHFGLDGARRILRANWGNAVDEVLDEEVIRANPHLRGMSIRQLINWAHKKAGS